MCDWQLRESEAERLPEVRSLSHKVANALVIDAWDRAQAARRDESIAAKVADLADSEKIAREVAKAAALDQAAALKRREQSMAATLVLRAQQQEEVERRELEEV